VTAVVPLKRLARAKQRLAEVLDPPSRALLARLMFDRVMAACAASEGIERIVVVTGCAETAEAAEAHGATAVAEDSPGLAAAMATADRHTADCPATLVVVGDLPTLTADELTRICAAGATSPSVVVAPTEDGGTGALLRRPPGALPAAFGPASAAAHESLASRAGIEPIRVHLPGAALDVDTPAELVRAAEADRGFGAELGQLRSPDGHRWQRPPASYGPASRV
jgi:2-phospho-L-lactate guanylyltransferase